MTISLATIIKKADWRVLWAGNVKLPEGILTSSLIMTSW